MKKFKEFLSEEDILKAYTRSDNYKIHRAPITRNYSDLEEKYPYEGGILYRGLYFSSPQKYLDFMRSLRGGILKTDSISSWTPDKETAKDFAKTPQMFDITSNQTGYMDYAKAQEEGEEQSGFIGIILSTQVPKGKGIDVSKAESSAEPEVILGPGTYRVKVEKSKKLRHKIKSKNTENTFLEALDNNDKKIINFILKNRWKELSEKTQRIYLSKVVEFLKDSIELRIVNRDFDFYEVDAIKEYFTEGKQQVILSVFSDVHSPYNPVLSKSITENDYFRKSALKIDQSLKTQYNRALEKVKKAPKSNIILSVRIPEEFLKLLPESSGFYSFVKELKSILEQRKAEFEKSDFKQNHNIEREFRHTLLDLERKLRRFDKVFGESYLQEKHIQTLYHSTTSVRVALKIIKSGHFKTTSHEDRNTEYFKGTALRFLSTSRSANMRFNRKLGSPAIFELDGNVIASKYKIRPFSYFKTRKKHEFDEKEERIFTKSPIIPITKRMIKAFHFFEETDQYDDEIIFEIGSKGIKCFKYKTQEDLLMLRNGQRIA